MILSSLVFELRPGAMPALEEVFRRHRIFERAIQTEGCRSLYLAADGPDASRARVIGVWDDEAAYQRWLDHPERELGTEELHALMAEGWDPSAPGEVWHVAHTAVAGLVGPATAAAG